jgi:NAD(P) transhydrogenase subunit alpha
MEILNLFSGESLLLIYVIVIATFVGIEVINNIPTVLHTPLMSGSNAISGIVIIGATIDVLKAAPDDYFSFILGFFAIALASINVFGGFLVTDRILGMFKKKK